MVKEFLFEDRASLFAALAQHCQGQLAKALTKYGAASLMVSGGSTPARFMKPYLYPIWTGKKSVSL